MTAPRYWFLPCASGDFRLVALTDEVCRLTVEDPTIQDYTAIQPFLAVMAEMGWVKPEKAIVRPKGLTTIDIRVGIAVAGPILVGTIHVNAETWTAVRCEDGRVTVNDGVDVTPAPAEPAKPAEPPTQPSTSLVPAEPALPAEPAVVAAVTVTPPRRGCPAPAACERRSSEVLRVFSTADQWASWQTRGRMTLYGSHTGARYTLFHRNEASARGLGHVLLAPAPEDVSRPRTWRSGSREVCVWDDGLPAEEEALGIKLAVEHREVWLLSPT